jgi:predicted Zn-dependent protease
VIPLVLLASGLLAQRPTNAAPEFTKQSLLIVNFTPPALDELDLGRDAGNAVRSRMARLANKEELQVIDGGLIEYQVRRAEYNPDASFSLLDMLAVGRYLRTDEYIMGYVAHENQRVRLSGDLRLIRDVHVRQPLPAVVAPTVDSAAQLFAQSIIVARRQLASQRRCENDLREGHPDKAVVAAREGVATYARSTLARTCLVVALTAARAPSTEVLSTAREVLAIDSSNTYALEAGAGALDALHRSAEAAKMWVRLADTDSSNADLGLLATTGLLGDGNAKLAEPIIDRLLADHPNDMQLVERKWTIEYKNQNWRGAIEVGERMLARDSAVKRDSAFVRDLALAYHAANEPYGAIAMLARGVAEYPGDASLYALYSRYIRTEADTVVPRGLALFPKNSEMLALSASVLRAKGKLAESLEATKKAVALDSTMSDGQLAIAQLEVQVGQLDSALVSLHRSLHASSDSSLAAQFALKEGNTLYGAAAETKASNDFALAFHYLTFADSLHSSPQSRFLVGAAAMGVGQSAMLDAAKLTDKTERCRLTQHGAEMIPVARTGLQAGVGDLAEAAKSSLDFLQQFEAYVEQQLKADCGGP